MSDLPILTCNAFLDSLGYMRNANIRRYANQWQTFEIESSLLDHTPKEYVVAGAPIEFHCHGMNMQDFSAFLSLDLKIVNSNAHEEGVLCVASVSLPYQYFNEFLSFMQRFALLRKNGELPYVVGISLEGPLLASFGGTPQRGTWAPTKAEWEKLAQCGELGLEYIVLSPDAMLPDSCLATVLTPEHPTIEWIIETLLQGGVRPALGHFQKKDPLGSAACIQSVLQVAKTCGNEPYSGRILTDHVFNDMPLKFRHAWRLPADKKLRSLQIKDLHIDEWTIDNLDMMLGEVPATLLRAAHAGQAILCINFDGEHVDLAVCRKIIELIGSKAICAITDSTDIDVLGGQKIWKKEGANLWYQENNIVAAGMSSLDMQIKNLRSIGISEAMIWDMVSFVPARVLGHRNKSLKVPQMYSYVSEYKQRYYINDSHTSAGLSQNLEEYGQVVTRGEVSR